MIIANSITTRKTLPVRGGGFDLGLLTAADCYQTTSPLWTKDLNSAKVEREHQFKVAALVNCKETIPTGYKLFLGVTLTLALLGLSRTS